MIPEQIQKLRELHKAHLSIVSNGLIDQIPALLDRIEALEKRLDFAMTDHNHYIASIGEVLDHETMKKIAALTHIKNELWRLEQTAAPERKEGE